MGKDVTEVRVIYLRPGEPPVFRVVNDTLKTYQDLVGGDIEGWKENPEGPLYMMCNADRTGLCFNFSSENVGEVYGPAIFSRVGKRGEELSVEDDDILEVASRTRNFVALARVR